MVLDLIVFSKCSFYLAHAMQDGLLPELPELQMRSHIRNKNVFLRLVDFPEHH